MTLYKTMMMKRTLTLVVGLILVTCSLAQKQELSYFLPKGITYNPAIPTPEAFFGFQIGEHHLSHDQLIFYVKTLAQLSNRFTVEEYGRSHENRPLILVTITSTENHKNLKKIKADHAQISDPLQSSKLDLREMPIVLYQGYTIHGNESSGANAVPLYAYFLAAAQGEEVEKILDNVVILLDPCFNPDGMNRFASWVNTHKSKNLIADPNSRELNEAWPGGRTNHYWFDLNRDWLPLTQPESEGRVAKFHEWKPNILTDHHEMGSNSSFFFQPGFPSRVFPFTPDANQRLTSEIGNFHAAALNEIGSMYFTKESYDDFYIGKGSTYPDVNGCIGILFEQASSRGHLQATSNGLLSFPFTIRNQLTTSFSTLKAAVEMRVKLLEYQRSFYLEAVEAAQNDPVKGYIFGDNFDQTRNYFLLELLKKHQIQVFELDKDQTINGQKFNKGRAFIVPTEQPQYRVIKGFFATLTTFTDSLFYDISAWTMPMAYNLPYVEVNKLPPLGEPAVPKLPKGGVVGGESSYAYLFRWDEYYTPRTLNTLLQAGLNVKVATVPFSIETSDGKQAFDYGTILLPVEMQTKLSKKEIFEMLKKVADRDGIEVFSVQTGLTLTGSNLGSNNFATLQAPKTLLVVGEGVTSYDAGEVWHLLDFQYDMPVTLVEQSQLRSVNWSDYNTLILVNGRYDFDKNVTETIQNWVQQGGIIVGFRGAINWLKSNGLARMEAKTAADITPIHRGKTIQNYQPTYAELENFNGAKLINGAIVETQIDLTHPLAYGYHRPKLPSFLRGTQFFKLPSNAHAAPIQYTAKPLLSGYISTENQEILKNSAAAFVGANGRGRVVCFTDDTNFRAFWFGTNKLFANAIFFGRLINRSATSE